MRRATMLLLCGLVLLLLVPTLLLPAVRFDTEEDVIVLREGWTDGDGRSLTLPAQTAACDGITLSRVLPDPLMERACLSVYTCCQTLTVLVDGETVYDYEATDIPLSLRSPDSAWHVISLPEGSGGAVVTLCLSSPYRFFSRILPQVTLGSRGALQMHLFRTGLPVFCSALLILGGGIALLIWLVLRTLDHRPTFGIIWLDAVLLSLSLTLVTQNAVFDLLLGQHLDTAALSVMLLLMCPLWACLMTADRLEQEKRGVVWRAAGLCDAALLTLCMLLHLLRVVDLLDAAVVLCCVQTALLLAVVMAGLRRERPLRWTPWILVLFLLTAVVFYFKARFSVALHVLCFGIIFYACRRILLKERQMMREKQSYQQEAAVMSASNMLVQIKTHFFYHTMASIRTLIRMNPDAAYTMITDLSRYLRYRVDRLNAPNGLVPLQDEMEAVEAYVHIKQTEMKDRLQLRTMLTSTDFAVPVFSVQALVENAIRHGLQPKPEGGCVLIRTYETADCHVITVRDNGVGCCPEEMLPGERAGALDNIRHRLTVTGEGSLTLIGRKGVGTKAILRLYKTGVQREETP